VKSSAGLIFQSVTKITTFSQPVVRNVTSQCDGRDGCTCQAALSSAETRSPRAIEFQRAYQEQPNDMLAFFLGLSRLV
jgi:hypothetical protein